LCVAVLAGCGRLGFGDHATGDAARGDGRAGDVLTSDAGICHTGTWSAPQLLAATATASEERGTSISSDELTLYFMSNRPGGQARAIWQTTRASTSDAFGAPTLIAELDSAQDDGDPSISDDGLTIYFYSQRSGSDANYYATRPTLTSPFVVQGPIPIAGDPSTARSSPEGSPDELTVVYIGDLDLQVATRATKTDNFTWVRELTELNAAQSEGNATVTADGLEIFFESYRSGPDVIYTATRATTNDVWSAPVAVPALAGTGTSYGSPSLSADGRTMYFYISDTQVDIYTATRDCL